MTDLIIRKPYGYRDERLYPAGWRSFLQEIYSLNSFEIISEIISLNGISGELTIEIISINDITSGIKKEIISCNVIELSVEIISLNDLIDPTIKEIVSLNVLSTNHIPEIIGINDILNYDGPYELEITGFNRLEEEKIFIEFSHTIKIFLDDSDITDYILNFSIDISEDNYVNSGKITFSGKEFFSQCNPKTRIEEKRIKIVIDGISYEFLLERRSLNRSPEDGFFNIWGRSQIAILDAPYSSPIIDKRVIEENGTWSSPDDDQYIPHIWQTSDRLASEIMEDVINGKFTLILEIDDFIVKKDSFIVTNETPIEIINRLAKVIGGYVRTNLNDEVIIRYRDYELESETVTSFSDLENIFLLEENLSFPEGYNKILIRGPKSALADQTMNLEIVLDEDLNEGETRFIFGADIWFRVYKSPFTLTYEISCSLGSVNLSSLNVSEIVEQESSGFSGTGLQTVKPIFSISLIERYNCTNLVSTEYEFEQGYKMVTSESGIEDEPVLITYVSQYDLYRLRVEQPCDPLSFDEVLSRIIVEHV
ncbi:MAG: hypothetical protein ACTSQE_16095 [Candidatus Heimdallarchaeaceae archaeon]